MNYEEALEFLSGHINFEILRVGRDELPTLDRMQELAKVLGNPQDLAPTIHVTGTNGKGSTSRMITALLAAHNLSVGTYTSPHLEKVNDRIGRNSEPTSDEEFAVAVEAVAEVLELVDIEPSYFEVLVGAAFAWFEEIATDVNVIEVGMGGRWDATNVVTAEVAVVTNVGTDHLDYLGPTRRDIAIEKSGVIKENSLVVLGETDPELRGFFESRPSAGVVVRDEDFLLTDNTLAVGGRLISMKTPLGEYEEIFLSLHGSHQADNALIALMAVETFFGRAIDEEVVAEAFGSVQMPGRFEVMGQSPLIVIDGAHNPDGAEAAARTLRNGFSGAGDLILVVGTNTGHDPLEMLEALDASSARLVIATSAEWQRARPASEIAAAAETLGCSVEIAESVSEAIESALDQASSDDTVMIVGSLYVVGEARIALEKQDFSSQL